ncbi:hypothetical protein FHX42_004992 [Saccharopolyspora lacisalsi]|uniref:Uncharacterized protein n=1 Tax=Halosaccharopolyspora lacisalsi TaxID=1000566 RepID=A0A839E4R2_9PSEU|nr:hypothetical protein [Halosaccharopolyspora lacisalsi]MBA8827596.1 hypothetical protein [Halosaccharopolyspora lacisalsi]
MEPLAGALRLAESGVGAERAASEPDATWVDGEPWPTLTYRLAALAHPAGVSALTAGATRRPEDVVRGFVRPVRRRDRLQAAGAGRWLATMPDWPPSLGLDAGPRFLDHMGAGDARVGLRVSAARLLRNEVG